MKKGFKLSLTTQILLGTVGGIVFGAIVGPWAANLKFIGEMIVLNISIPMNTRMDYLSLIEGRKAMNTNKILMPLKFILRNNL